MSSLPNPFATTSQPYSPLSPYPTPTTSTDPSTSLPSTTPLFTAGGSAHLTHSPSRRAPGTPVQLTHPARPQHTPTPLTEQQRTAQAAEAEALRHRVRAAFDRWDADGDGAVSVADLAAVLSAAESPISAQQLLTEFITPVDTNRDGRIEWVEFEAAYMRKLRRDRFQPPEDVVTDMEQDLHRKKEAVGRGGAGGGQQPVWKVGDSAVSTDGGSASMQQ